jgi:hypothetical protein
MAYVTLLIVIEPARLPSPKQGLLFFIDHMLITSYDGDLVIKVTYVSVHSHRIPSRGTTW